ncbi:MAG: phosphoribosylformimino-5-aminoimidazole carboxamide ribotide isomerase [Verrucomicrobia bacterium]|nr:phosphoribosylformimino-5-aminoimidazole carboxamide ribotide isomerase [Verrucomicrobiota bacterium]
MFRPCIDLHQGKVKQIVGGTLSDHEAGLKTNFVSTHPPEYFAELYRQDQLQGGHVIMLGPGNEPAALAALRAFPGGLQLGGGIHPGNAKPFLDAGASHIIVTSYVFREGALDQNRLSEMVQTVGKNRLVLDLSCRIRNNHYWVVTDRWQKFTSLSVSAVVLRELSHHCGEFLIHAVDVEGLCRGVDLNLVRLLGEHSPIPSTYAGGASSLEDFQAVESAGQGRVDLTIGSALDLFGGTGVRYTELVEFNRKLMAARRHSTPSKT